MVCYCVSVRTGKVAQGFALLQHATETFKPALSDFLAPESKKTKSQK